MQAGEESHVAGWQQTLSSKHEADTLFIERIRPVYASLSFFNPD